MTRPSVARMRDTTLRALARLWPTSVAADSPERARALRFLRWDVRPATVVAAGYATGVVAAFVVLPVAVLVGPVPVPVAPVLAAAVGVVVVHAIHETPVAVAAVRRTTALGAVPDLLVRVVLRMRVSAALEPAAAFAARSGRGPLARSLADHVERARGTPGSGLDEFAEEWSQWFPPLDRAAALLTAAAAAPPEDRTRTLDRAMDAVLDGTSDQMATFANDVRAPATALYAFGVLLPLALVAVLPAARVAGVAVSLPAFAFAYDLTLPAVVVAASGWLLVRRPVAFPPPTVDRSHPDVPSRRWPAVVTGVVVAVAAFLLMPRLLARWSGPVAAVGFGLGTTLVWLYRPIATVRRRVRSLERKLPDALHLVGRRVAEGESVERAVERAADDLSGEMGRVMSRAAQNGRRLRLDVHDSFLGPHGALATVPSPRARSAAALLSVAATEGRPAGRAVAAVADHLDELSSVEREARRSLARVTTTLGHTAAVFGPLVAGATVALADGLALDSDATAEGASATVTAANATLPTAGLGLAVGAYVLFLAAALSALAVSLRHGFDAALVGYRAGLALLSGTAMYLVTVRAVGLLV